MRSTRKQWAPPLISHDCVAEVARLAGLSESRAFIQDFQELLEWAAIDFATWHVRTEVCEQARKSLKIVSKHAEKLRNALDLLNALGRESLAIQTYNSGGDEQFLGMIEKGEMVSRLDLFIEEIRDLSCAAQVLAKKSNSGGRPRKGSSRYSVVFGESPFENFVQALERRITIHGGKTTFNKNDGTGSLTEILRLLAPFLQKGFLPQWIVDRDYSETLNAAAAIFEIKRQTSLRWIWLREVFHTEIKHPYYLGNTLFLSSGRWRHVRKVGRHISRSGICVLSPAESVELSECAVREVMPMQVWRKRHWKKAEFLS
jgi:hypothetical protein